MPQHIMHLQGTHIDDFTHSKRNGYTYHRDSSVNMACWAAIEIKECWERCREHSLIGRLEEIIFSHKYVTIQHIWRSLLWLKAKWCHSSPITYSCKFFVLCYIVLYSMHHHEYIFSSLCEFSFIFVCFKVYFYILLLTCILSSQVVSLPCKSVIHLEDSSL